MSKMKRIFALLTVLALCLTTAAASAATVTKDGLEITLTTDKSSYAIGEKIALTVTVANKGTAPVKGVDVSCLLPEMCELDGAQSASETIEMLEPGKSATFSTKLCVGGAPEEPELPVTGDDSNLLLWAVLLGGSVLAFVKMGRRARMRAMALLLCAVTVCGVLCGNLQTASAEGGERPAEKFELGAIRTGDEALYQRALKQIGKEPKPAAEQSSVIVSETVEIAGVMTELSVKVSSAGEKLSAAYLYENYVDRPLSETISETTTMYNKTVGAGVALPQTTNPYSSNADELYIINGGSSAKAMTIYFSSDSELENNWDSLIVYDQYGNYINYYTGTALSDLTISLSGNRIYLRLLTDLREREVKY